MSLIDALLLEPAPFEVWIALRTDGQKGSGRIDDPYDGSTSQDAPIVITSIVPSGDLKEATVTTSAAHGYDDDDYIRVTGATGNDAKYYNGAFIIFDASGTTFKYRMKWKPNDDATGTLSSARITGYRFDEIMRDLPANTTIRLGPGVFETKGYRGGQAQPLQPKAGQKFIGSGIGATTLKVMEATYPASLTLAIGGDYNNFLSSFEASDFTVDCNLPNQPILEGQHFSNLACGAIGVTGRDIRIRRIRAINFGTQTQGIECFVITAAGAHPAVNMPVNCLIEDCIIERPSETNAETITCLHLGGGEADFGSVVPATYHNSCAIRNCYVNGAFRNGAISTFLTIELLTRPDPVNYPLKWRIKTYLPHNYTTGEHYVVNVRNVFKFENPNYLLSPHFNGTFHIDAIPSVTELDYTLTSTPDHDPVLGQAVIANILQALSADNGIASVVEGNRIFNCNTAGPYHDTYSSRDLTVRYNYYRNVYYGVAQTVGQFGIAKNGTTLTRSGMTATFTTPAAHSFYDGQAVQISLAEVPDGFGGFTPFNPYNGLFEIKVTGATTFTYEMNPGPDPSPTASASGPFQFRPLWQIGRLIVEKNVIELAKVPDVPSVGAVAFILASATPLPAGPYTYPEVIYRNNLIRHASSADPHAYALVGNSCGSIIVERNVVALDKLAPLVHLNCGAARYFENLNAIGSLVRGYSQTSGAYQTEMRDHIDLVFLLEC